MRRWTGGPGGYHRTIPKDEEWVAAGPRRTSKTQTQIFAVLDYALGHGKQDVLVHGDNRGHTVDMLFRIPYGPAVIVEYDGAFFHRDRAERDRDKAEDLSAAVWPLYHPLVVRIRESPLEPLRLEDVVVPGRAKPGLCARLTILHLAHLLPQSDWQVLRAVPFLRSGGALAETSILCPECIREWRIHA